MPKALLPIEKIQQHILVIRGEKVMLDPHLALLYGVETGVLIQAVKRNIERFSFEAIHQLMIPPEPKNKRSIGFAEWKGK